MSNRTRGAAFGTVIIGLLVVAAVVFGALYFFSDVIRTKADAAYSQFSEWTPENIAKDPVNYLNFAEEQAKQALEDLRASRISIEQKRGALQAQDEDARQTVEIGEKALTELKALYKEAEAADQWPVQWSGKDLDKDKLMRQIVALHNQTEAKKGLREKIQQGLKKLDVQLNKVAQGTMDCDEQIASIQANREMLKVDAITEDITQQLVAMKGVLSSTVATASAMDDSVRSLEDIAAESEGTVDMSEFEKILNN